MKKFIVLIACCLFSCNKNPVTHNDKMDFAIYLLEDSELSYMEASEYNLDTLEIESTPWLSLNDIEMYDFSTHYIYLSTPKETIFEGLMNEAGIFDGFLLKPFLLVAGQERIYLGEFISALSSSFGGCCPHIDDIEQRIVPSDILPIRGCNIQGMPDVRNDSRIATVLSKNKIYHVGISVELKNVEVIDNADTASIVYSFEITNNDKDDLFIPDPDLMGTELFHYYTNGILFLSEDNHYYSSQYKKTIEPTPYDSWKTEWFSKVPSKGTLQQTVHLKGYPQLPPGQYNCEFVFAGPNKIEEGVRMCGHLRYWIGEVKSTEIQMEISN